MDAATGGATMAELREASGGLAKQITNNRLLRLMSEGHVMRVGAGASSYHHVRPGYPVSVLLPIEYLDREAVVEVKLAVTDGALSASVGSVGPLLPAE